MGIELPERVVRRQLTPDEVLRISRGERVPYLRDDPVVRAIRRAAVGVIGELMFKEARANGYLVLTPAPHLIETNQKVATLWGWWCHAAREPEATVDLQPRVGQGGAGPRVRVDLSPTGREFRPAAMVPIGRVCAEQGAGVPGLDDRPGWIAMPDVVEIEAPDLDSAGAIVRVILALARDERWLVAEGIKIAKENAS